MLDSFHRRISYLRVSITDRCNLNCIYCRPDALDPKLPHADILSYEEILRIVSVGTGIGITKVRVTGGEPLVRKGVCSFLTRLSKLNGLADLSLTTNGLLLHQNLTQLKSAGIQRINISLDTLDPAVYRTITGHDAFHRVWESITAAHRMGFAPIKLNAVAIRGVNESDLVDLARLSLDYPFHIRFIEQMPTGADGKPNTHPLLTDEIIDRVSVLGELLPVEKNRNDGPARRFRFKNAPGEIGFISPLSHHFCKSCNRLRLTADGHLKVCLLSDKEIDIKGPLRSGCSDDHLAELITSAASEKPEGHGGTIEKPGSITGRMSSIGG
jgi:cyclic pyranopterin phosphate synthase